MKNLILISALLVNAAAMADDERPAIEHVLMVSIDGMHQQDLSKCIAAKTCPNLAKLAKHGVNYTRAYAPGLTDSVPGLAALVVGGSPRSTGLFYDDIYDRTLYAGTDTQCTGVQGVEVFLQEVVGIDALNGGKLVRIDGGGDFNPQQIPRRKVDGNCLPVYPHNFIKTNMIFEVVKQHLDGKDSTGTRSAPIPTVFGTNFQTLSVAQKARNYQGGGYADASFTPNTHVAAAITYVDNAIGRFIAELKAKHLRDSTLVIVTAKHGQSPADYSKLRKIGHAVSHALGAYLGSGSDSVTGNNLGGGQVTDDDVAFVWLNDQSQRDQAVDVLNAMTACPSVDPVSKVVLSSTSLICTDNGGAVVDLSKVPSKFGDPADGRTPDIMVQPNAGVIYTTSGGKDMEHGGFAPDDGHLALLVSHPSIEGETVTERVQTTQVAPTIIRALGLDPRLLDAVKQEGTPVLPGVFTDD